MSGITLHFGDDGRFKSFLLERWEAEGKSPASFDTKVWRWLMGNRPAETRDEKRYVDSIRRWAFRRTDNDTIYRARKARGHYQPSSHWEVPCVSMPENGEKLLPLSPS